MFRYIPRLAIAATLLIASISAQSISHPVRLAAYAQSCGPKLAAKTWFTSDKKPRMTFSLTSKHSGSLAVWFLGVQKTNIPIANTGCGLYTMPILIYPFVTGIFGGTSFDTVVPKKFIKTVYMQMAVFPLTKSGFTLKTTNGVSITRITRK